jgi:protein-S-isoprenylcysteine O-methyltransferase Ste14
VFNVEQQEQWDAQEAAKFEEHATKWQKEMNRGAIRVGAALLLDIVCVVPFLYVHSLHRYWEVIGKYLLILAMALFLWFVLRVGFAWSSWQSIRERRRALGDPNG